MESLNSLLSCPNPSIFTFESHAFLHVGRFLFPSLKIELELNNELNPNYKGGKLKDKLRDEISKNIAFSSVQFSGCISILLIYNANITVNTAVALAYLVAIKDIMRDVAIKLRAEIIEPYKNSSELKWPPTAKELSCDFTSQFPTELVRFLNLILSSSEPELQKCEKTHYLVLSLCQDICRAVTNGEWKLPKHILLCATVRHTLDKQLTTTLNRLGHFESYDLGLELETAIAEAINQNDTYLTPDIVLGDQNAVFHSKWDNLNKVRTNLIGNNLVNSAAGIMMQEIKQSTNHEVERVLPYHERITKEKKRAYQITNPEVLPPVNIYCRLGPNFPTNALFDHPCENESVYHTRLQDYYI